MSATVKTKATHTAIPANPELVKAIERIVVDIQRQQQQLIHQGQARINEVAYAFRGVDKVPEGHVYDHQQKAWTIPPIPSTDEGK